MINPVEIKQQVYEHCQNYVLDLIKRAQHGLHEAQQEANREQKSSAGDKFETHRAMMHLQMESFLSRLHVAQELDRQLHLVSLHPTSSISLGSLVVTDQGCFFIAISAPAYPIQGQEYVCLSTQAPFYKAMHGLEVGDWIEWSSSGNENEEIEILALY